MSPKASPAQTSFNAGELSPRLEGRTDIAKYANGCRTLENFLPTVQGGVIKRSGTRFVKEVKTSLSTPRLVPFEFGTTQAYILEFGELYVRVYMDNGGVLEGTFNINAVSATTPIVITTTAAHGYVDGEQVFVSGSGAAAINAGYYNINVTGATTFELLGTASVGAAGAGGTVARCYEFVTTYAAADLEGLQFAQSADVLYVAHPSYPPRKISRTGHAAWTIADVGFDAPPFSQENLDPDEYVVPTAQTGAITLYSTGGRFTAAMIGGYVKLAENLEGMYPEWEPMINPVGTVGSIAGYQIGGVAWGGSAANNYLQYQGRLYRRVAAYGGPWTGGAPPLHEIGIQNDGTIDFEYVNSGYGWIRITAVTDAYVAAGTVVREIGESHSVTAYVITAVAHAAGIATITTSVGHNLLVGDIVFVRGTLIAAVDNRTYVVLTVPAGNQITVNTGSAGAAAVGTVIRCEESRTTGVATRRRREFNTRWALGAFSGERGYPSSVAFFEDRLWWAGTASDPQGLWASRTGRYEDHLLTDEDDGALFLLLNTQQVNKIEWLSAGKRLAVGTAGGEFILTGATDGPVTAGNVKANQHSFYGSRTNAPPIRVESVTLFVQRSGQKLIEYGFDFESDNYIGADLTVLAHHVTASLLKRIKKLAWAQEPDRTVWAVLENGDFAAMTYDRAQEVVAWHRHVIGGTSTTVQSVAVIPHPDGDRGQVWLIVKRTINGTAKRYVEYFEETWLQGTSIDDAVFVDGALTYDGAPANTITGLWHFLNHPVAVLANGVIYEGMTVSATGSITFPGGTNPSKVHVGMAYEAVLETMRLEAGAADGTAQGKTKRITNVVLRLEEVGKGLYYGPTFDELAIGAGSIASGVLGELVSGDTIALPWPSGHEQEGRINLKHNKPTPCTIIAIFPQVVTED